MKLYEINKRDVLVKYNDGKDSAPFLFHHIDGMYSLCTNRFGETFHPAAWTEVEIVDNYPRKDWREQYDS